MSHISPRLRHGRSTAHRLAALEQVCYRGKVGHGRGVVERHAIIEEGTYIKEVGGAMKEVSTSLDDANKGYDEEGEQLEHGAYLSYLGGGE